MVRFRLVPLHPSDSPGWDRLVDRGGAGELDGCLGGGASGLGQVFYVDLHFGVPAREGRGLGMWPEEPLHIGRGFVIERRVAICIRRIEHEAAPCEPDFLDHSWDVGGERDARNVDLEDRVPPTGFWPGLDPEERRSLGVVAHKLCVPVR